MIKKTILLFYGAKITKHILRQILKLCSRTVFLYYDKVYRQIDGVEMGSLLAPILVIFFVESNENIQLNQKTKSVFYARYVDYIVLMKNSIELNIFFYEIWYSYIWHSNLQFTLERSTDSRLPFLDTEVKLISNRLYTSVYRKPTGTNVVMQYTSVCPKAWKIGLIEFYLNRALSLCRNYQKL